MSTILGIRLNDHLDYQGDSALVRLAQRVVIPKSDRYARSNHKHLVTIVPQVVYALGEPLLVAAVYLSGLWTLAEYGEQTLALVNRLFKRDGGFIEY